ncbi:hypothetical protein MUG10_01150 [Xanthomonas prunicola]|uniref:hypothetical protein n=1 Tax=Xanthomonas prunicola TaxID=2053930 RepID=UPI00207855F1|nr:hypothetical protein [Xanthomonas prunicola]USJ00904.1 hypothetical protein MUG10_01150 [Xanthomonas prunicola]
MAKTHVATQPKETQREPMNALQSISAVISSWFGGKWHGYVITASVGAAIALLWAGVPVLTRTNGIATLSICVTAFAALIALYVGLKPIREQRRAHLLRAEAACAHAEAALSIQVMQGLVAQAICDGDEFIENEIFKRVHAELSLLDASPLRELLPFLDVLSTDLSRQVLGAIVDLDRLKIMLGRISLDGDVYRIPAKAMDVFWTTLTHLDRFKARLAAERGQTPEPITEAKRLGQEIRGRLQRSSNH